jgi:hypothetical protein
MLRFSLPLVLSLAAPLAGAVDFSHQVVPILKKHCAECHAGDKKKGGFSFNTRADLMTGSENGPVMVAGKPEKSRFIEVVATSDRDEQMPPKGDRVSAAELELLRAWVSAGLPWEEGFAFQKPAYEPPLKPRRPVLPESSRPDRSHPVDRILDAYLKGRQKPIPERVDDATFARRASLDLTGLLPTAERLSGFLADSAADKRTRFIQSLLADEINYTEHWLTFWNDLLRNDYGGTGFITGGRKQVSKWLYEALVTNKPADQMTRELIAPITDESRGFIDGIKWRGEVSAGQTVEIQFAQSVGQSFLGINMKCASCHDSFIDRWKLDEAYGLAAIYSKRPLDIARCDKPTGRLAKAAWLFPELGQVDAQADQPLRLKQLAALMTHPNNGRFTRTLVNRLWHRLMGRGIVHPVDAMQTEPWSADLLDHLATFLQENKYDLKKTLAHIATSQAYQSQAEVLEKGADDQGYTYAGPRSKRLTAEQFVDAVWQLTQTAPAKMDAPVMRGKPDPATFKSIKLSGQWLWGDSASKGTPPSGESVVLRKTFTLPHAAITASAVVTADNSFSLYVNGRLVSRGDDWNHLEAVPMHDRLKVGENTLVIIAKNAGRGPNAAGAYFEARIRHGQGTETTVVSDASWEVHSAAPASKEGRLGALPVKGWKPATLVKALPVWTQVIERDAPALLAQASLISQRPVRASLMKSDFLMRALGRPNRDQIVSERPNELTTLEAIDLSNGAILTETMALGAKKLLGQKSWPDLAAFTRWLYLSTLCRSATEAEVNEITQSLGTQLTEQSLADTLWAVVMLPEFQRVR